MPIEMNTFPDCILQKLVQIFCTAADEGSVDRNKIQDILGTAVKGKLSCM